MTIGERIAQIRKERGLSQEAFGETLGVTRQSVSKWEVNSSIPEVDKLLEMSKLYGVSIAWLLGEESERVNGNQELSEEQWEMVGTITEKYLSSMSQKKSKFHKWYKVITIMLVCVLIIGSISFCNSIRVLNNKITDIQKELADYQKDVSIQMEEMAMNIEHKLWEQEHILREWDVKGEQDVFTGMVTYEISAIPKVYVMGMRVEFVFWSDGQIYTAKGIEEEQLNRFTATCQIPYSDEIQISAVLYANEEKQTQIIHNSGGMESSTKVYTLGDTSEILCRKISEFEEAADGKICLTLPLFDAKFSTILSDVSESNIATAKSVLWKLYKNEQLAQTIEGELSKENVNVNENEDGSIVRLTTAYVDHEMLCSLEKGDSFWVVLIVTDNYDREYVVAIDTYRVTDEMFLESEESSLDFKDSKWFE